MACHDAAALPSRAGGNSSSLYCCEPYARGACSRGSSCPLRHGPPLDPELLGTLEHSSRDVFGNPRGAPGAPPPLPGSLPRALCLLWRPSSALSEAELKTDISSRCGRLGSVAGVSTLAHKRCAFVRFAQPAAAEYALAALAAPSAWEGSPFPSDRPPRVEWAHAPRHESDRRRREGAQHDEVQRELREALQGQGEEKRRRLGRIREALVGGDAESMFVVKEAQPEAREYTGWDAYYAQGRNLGGGKKDEYEGADDVSRYLLPEEAAAGLERGDEVEDAGLEARVDGAREHPVSALEFLGEYGSDSEEGGA